MQTRSNDPSDGGHEAPWPVLLPDRERQLAEALGATESAREFSSLHEALLKAVLDQDLKVALDTCQRALDEWKLPGYFALFIRLINPVIRQLETIWRDDAERFDRIVGAHATLHQALQDLSSRSMRESIGRPVQGRIFLTTLERAEHVFGAMAAAHRLREAGWQVDTNLSGVTRFTSTALQTHHYDALAVSVGNDVELERVNSFVAQMRKLSLNPNILVMAGGNVFSDGRDGFGFLDVDLVARNVDDALSFINEALASGRMGVQTS